MIAPRLRWVLPEPILDRPALAGFSPPMATLLTRRRLTDAADLRTFLEAGAEAFAPIELMADAPQAIDRIESALEAGERIAVWGDYDADGMTAVAVWMLALRAAGADPLRYIPSRLSEGYGLSLPGLASLAARGARLLITCDCGIADVAAVAAARQMGLDVIVTDHHLPGDELPAAVAVVDPHRADCEYPDADLTGAGLAFRLASVLLARRGLVVPGLAGIAAIGTVADVAPMTGESRVLVRLGLAELAASRRGGLRALLARSCDNPARPTARDLAFGVAPRINAAGRIADCELAIALLLEDQPDRAEQLADELESVHRSRRELTAMAIESAAQLVGEAADTPLALRNDEWPPGIVGLVAARLAETLARPVAVATLVGDELRGSVRAPADFHVAQALAACGAFLTKRGGHAAAGGFSCAPGSWDSFVAAFGVLPRPYPIGAAPALPGGALAVDLVLPASHLGWPLLAELDRLAPYGPGNVEPLLAVTGLRTLEARRVGPDGRHVWLRMRRNLEVFDAIAFGTPAERPLPEPGAALDLVCTLQRDVHEGQERLRLRVEDYADSAMSPLVERRRVRLRAVS